MKNLVLFAIFLIAIFVTEIKTQTTLQNTVNQTNSTISNQFNNVQLITCFNVTSGSISSAAQVSNATSVITAATFASIFNPLVSMGVLNASVVASVLNSSSINSLVSNAQSAGILNAATSNLISNSLNGQIVSSFPLPQCSLSNNQNQNNQNSQNNQNFPGATTARPNFGSYDPNYLFLTQTYLGNSQNATLIAATISQISTIMSYFNGKASTYWNGNCQLASAYYTVATQAAFNPSLNINLTQQGIISAAACKPDCNFGAFFANISGISGTYTNSQFANKLLNSVNVNLIGQCKTILAPYLTLPPTNNSISSSQMMTLIQAGGTSIALFTPAQLGNLSPDNALSVAGLVGSSNQVSKQQAHSIARNLPPTANLSQIVGIAQALPPNKFTSVPPMDIANNIANMNIASMNNFQLAAIGTNLMTNAAAATSVLTNTNNDNLKNSLTYAALLALNVSFTSIPANNLPRSVGVNMYNSLINGNTSLSSVTDTTQLSRILSGIKSSDVAAIATSSKVSSVVNMMNASSVSGVLITGSQRTSLRSALIAGLQGITGSTVPLTYLANLTTDQVALTYELFIEAPTTILDAFLSLSTGSTLYTTAATLSSSRCCSFTRTARAAFALRILTNLGITSASSIQSSDLANIGTCFITVLPSTYINSLTISSIITYYGSLSYNFQPDDATITVLSSKIDAYVGSNSNSSTISTFFTSISSMSLAISSNAISNFGSSIVSTNGFTNFINTQSAYDLTSTSVQQCRVGLTNSANVQTQVSNLAYNVAVNYINVKFNTTSSRRKRATVTLTCTDITTAGTGATSFTTTTLQTLSLSEFTSCVSTIGAISSWSSAQLAIFYSLAIQLYPSTSAISDTNIISLNSILLGYPTAQLALLNFTSTTSIQYLGLLSTWSTDQLSNGLSTALTNYFGSSLASITSTQLSAMGNLVCALSTIQINSILTAVLNSALPTLKTISNQCPNLNTLYTAVKTAQGGVSTSSLTEMGAVVGGMVASDMTGLSDSSYIAFISSTAFSLMPAATVNAMSSSQIGQLSSAQISSLINSPYYSSFSSSFISTLKSEFGLSLTGSAITSNVNFISMITCMFIGYILRK